ncbi:MAG: Fic family protein [Anaerovoracaceae bacterium]
MLKTGTSNAKKDWFAVGDYDNKENATLENIIEFHAQFERIHPFQDGNGRVGRLIMFKECLKYNIVPLQ